MRQVHDLKIFYSMIGTVLWRTNIYIIWAMVFLRCEQFFWSVGTLPNETILLVVLWTIYAHCSVTLASTWSWSRSRGWGQSWRRGTRRWRRSRYRVLWRAMRVGEGMWCEKRLDGAGKGRGNGCLYLPSLGDLSGPRRHAHIALGIGLVWHDKYSMSSLSISIKSTQAERKRLATKARERR